MADETITGELITAGMLCARLRPLVLAACDGKPPNYFGSSCLNGTPMIPLHRSTVSAIYQHLERLAALDGETTELAEISAAREWAEKQKAWPYG